MPILSFNRALLDTEAGPIIQKWVDEGLAQLIDTDAAPDFDGGTYAREHDHARLTRQHARVRDLMLDGKWRTLDEIAAGTGDPTASISARLRDLRKRKFGSFTVTRRARGDRRCGLFEYQVLPPVRGEEIP